MARATAIVGKNAKVALGSSKVNGMGNWKYTPPQADDLDATEFEDLFEMTEAGMKKGGQVTFEGVLDITDSQQENLIKAWAADTKISNLRLYVNATSYYEPCRTTGYLSPTNTTGMNTVLSSVNIKQYSLDVDKNGIAKVSFTAKVSGLMVLV